VGSPLVGIGLLGSSSSLCLILWLFYLRALDDILLISSDSLALAAATTKAVNLLMGKGFLVSPHPKSVTEPTTSIDWLGKHIHSTDGGIFVSTPPLVLALLASLIIFARAKKGPARIIRTICGIVSWCNYHSRLAFPFLHHSQHDAHSDARRLSLVAFNNLISALHISSIPTASTPIRRGLDVPLHITHHPAFLFRHPMQDLAPTHILAFTDASYADGRMGVVLAPAAFPNHDGDVPVVAYSSPLPVNVDNQQTAELYTLKYAIVKFLSAHRHITFIADSESSLYTISKGSTKIRHHVRSKVIRQIARKLLTVKTPNVALAFIPGSINPADLFSRLNIDGIWQGLISPNTPKTGPRGRCKQANRQTGTDKQT